MDKRTETGASLVIVGLQEHFTMDTAQNIPALWTRLGRYISQIPGKTGNVAWGVVSHPTDGVSGFEYVAGMEASGLGEVPGDLVTVRIPEQTYLVYSHEGYVSKLRDTMNAIWRDWISAPEHKGDTSLDVLERYGEGFDPVAELGDIEVWVPLSGRLPL